MSKRIKYFTYLILFAISNIAYPAENKQIIWTAVFSKAIPVRSNISQDYCDQHTPTVMVTTIDQITSKAGVRALNGVVVRYLSYKEIEKDHLNFNIVDATISGQDKNGKRWSSTMKLYEQTLNPVDITYTVWSTPYCKGTFLGTPTTVKTQGVLQM
jgi:hypothetical protein